MGLFEKIKIKAQLELKLFLWTAGILLLSIFLILYTFLESKFDSKQKSIPVNFPKNAKETVSTPKK